MDVLRIQKQPACFQFTAMIVDNPDPDNPKRLIYMTFLTGEPERDSEYVLDIASVRAMSEHLLKLCDNADNPNTTSAMSTEVMDDA